MLFAQNSIVSNLRILRYIGAGAFGEVYQAIDLVLNRECAVKFVENKDPSAFKAHIEGQVLHACKHDRVVDVYDVQPIEHAGKKYAAIEMEYLPDGSTEDYLTKRHVSLRRALRWTIDVLFALENAHGRSVLHRDIKPANIMLKGQEAKLSDFGLAKDTGGVPHGSAAGTPVYSAPELFAAQQTSVLTDLYSTGVSLFQLATNLRDWSAVSLSADTIRQGRQIKKLGIPHYLPDRFRRLCIKACNPDPTKRYQSAREMRQALESVSVKLEWVQDHPNDWSAEDGAKRHRITISPGRKTFEVVYQINGRRKNDRCAFHQNMTSAIKSMHEIIATSSLRS